MAIFEHCYKMARKLSFDKTFTKRTEKKSLCNGTSSAANSLQNFSASPEETFGR
jgi:hypothetical protein